MYLSFSPLALTGRIGNCASVAPGSPGGCVTGVRHGAVHADSRHAFEDSLETPEEGAAVQGAGRGGDYTETTAELEIEEGVWSGLRIVRPDASDVADAHAGDRLSKRLRTSTS